jgi:hypothetical protein
MRIRLTTREKKLFAAYLSQCVEDLQVSLAYLERDYQNLSKPSTRYTVISTIEPTRKP